jgi:hypothetical protein
MKAESSIPVCICGTQPCGIGSLESILGLLKSLKVRAQIVLLTLCLLIGFEVLS